MFIYLQSLSIPLQVPGEKPARIAGKEPAFLLSVVDEQIDGAFLARGVPEMDVILAAGVNVEIPLLHAIIAVVNHQPIPASFDRNHIAALGSMPARQNLDRYFVLVQRELDKSTL